ncbi:MAG: class beta-lactamase [Pseudomonadota bacterium]|jgi:beta-lactamase class A
MDRRLFLLGLTAASATPAFARPRPPAAPPVFAGQNALEKLEARVGGRLGAFVLDPAGARGFGWRAGERFAQCSTFKLSLAALALREIDAGRLNGAEVLPYSVLDILPNSPVAEAHAGKADLTILGMIEGAQTTSDNLCANLVLRRLGGPAALTQFWRDMGDTTSRLDRYETDLNAVAPGEVQDTTSPEAIARSAATFLLGPVLSPASRQTLLGWMMATQTGLARIRAGVPPSWRAGDKTGTALIPGYSAKLNDIAVLYPPTGNPLVVTAFYEPPGDVQDMRPQDQAVLAEVGRIAADAKSWKPRR